MHDVISQRGQHAYKKMAARSCGRPLWSLTRALRYRFIVPFASCHPLDRGWNLSSNSNCSKMRDIHLETGNSSAAEQDKPLVLGEESFDIERRWKRKFLDTQYLGDAIFVLGPMGVGKTTVINRDFKRHPVFRHYAFVDTDEIMGMLNGFASDKVEEFYPVARHLAIRLTDWILEQKISFVAEGTCVKYLELIDYIHRLKSTGYKVRVKWLPFLSLETVLERARLRRNRLVPDHVVRSIYHGSREGIQKLIEYNKDGSLFEEMECVQERDRAIEATSVESTS